MLNTIHIRRVHACIELNGRHFEHLL